MRRNLSRRQILGGAAASVAALTVSTSTRADPKIHEIVIKRFTYEPEAIQVQVGDIIRWTNLDIAPHTASANDLSWDTKELKRDESAQITVEDGMELTYFCVFHPHMRGVIEIV